MSENDHAGEPSASAPASTSPPRPVSANEAVCRMMHERVSMGLLPPPPASAVEWRERAIRIFERMPGLRDELGNMPVGWFPLVEHAVVEIRRRLLPGQFFRTNQLKEKFGTLRWYGYVGDGTDGAVANTGAEGPVGWAEDVSASTCAVFGTPGARIDNAGGWLLTLSARASLMRRESEASGSRGRFGALMYPRWDD